MMGVSKGAVWTAGLVLLGAASVGSYLGYSRAAAAPGGDADADAYTATTPLNARKATSVDAATAPPPVDEAYIRKIAHDEAETILHPPKKVTVATASDDSDDSDDHDAKSSPGANPPTPPPTPAAPPPAPAEAKPPPPPPTGLY